MLNFSFLAGAWPLLATATLNTALYSIAAFAIGLPTGILACIALLSKSRIAQFLGALYVSFFRGVPLLVLLLIAYYALPSLGLNTTAAQAAIIALASCEGAYLAECLRGGFLALPKGQTEAAEMSGLNPCQTFQRIVLPQVLRLTLPAVMNEATMAIKASALISVVGVLEITRVSQNLASSTYRPLEVYLTAGALYLLVTILVVVLNRFLSSRLNAGHS